MHRRQTWATLYCSWPVTMLNEIQWQQQKDTSKWCQFNCQLFLLNCHCNQFFQIKFLGGYPKVSTPTPATSSTSDVTVSLRWSFRPDFPYLSLISLASATSNVTVSSGCWFTSASPVSVLLHWWSPVSLSWTSLPSSILSLPSYWSPVSIGTTIWSTNPMPDVVPPRQWTPQAQQPAQHKSPNPSSETSGRQIGYSGSFTLEYSGWNHRWRF